MVSLSLCHGRPCLRHPTAVRGRARGFTLIELMVALGLAVLLATLALPDLGDFSAQNAVRAQADALATSLKFSRNEAIRSDQVVSICPIASGAALANPPCKPLTIKTESATSWTNGWIAFLDTNADQLNTASANIRNLYRPSSLGVSITTSGINVPNGTGGMVASNSLTFTPEGISLSDTATFTVSAPLSGGRTATIVITVYPSGLIQMGSLTRI